MRTHSDFMKEQSDLVCGCLLSAYTIRPVVSWQLVCMGISKICLEEVILI